MVKVSDIIIDNMGRRKGPCIGCGVVIFLNDNFGEALHPNQMQGVKYSVNGSVQLANGIIFLVNADMEAYKNNTLRFYDNLNKVMV